jgi:antirestriction protein ArdC
MKGAIHTAKKLIAIQSMLELNGIPYLLEEDIYEGAELSGLNGLSPEEAINKIIIAQIESGESLSWKKSWASSSPLLARNFISKKPYTGVNAILLNVIYGATAPSPYYLTFKQIGDLKGTLKKGSKGYPVVFYTFSYKIKSNDTVPGILAKVVGKTIRRGKGKSFTITESNYTKIYLTQDEVNSLGLDSNEVFSISNLRYYNVFNIADTEGIDYTIPTPQVREEHEIIDLAEAIIKSYTDMPIVRMHPEYAAYLPKEDILEMPKPEQFFSSQAYYATLFHEMIHSTGHKSRLDRFEKYKGKDDNASYAFEELVAELGASYLCGHAGIFHVTRDNQAAYIKNWKERLLELAKGDANFILEASKEAQKAATHILRNFNPEIQETPPQGKKDDKEKEKLKARIRIQAKIKIAKAKLKLNS